MRTGTNNWRWVSNNLNLADHASIGLMDLISCDRMKKYDQSLRCNVHMYEYSFGIYVNIGHFSSMSLHLQSQG